MDIFFNDFSRKEHWTLNVISDWNFKNGSTFNLNTKQTWILTKHLLLSHFKTGQSTAIGAGDVCTDLLVEGASYDFPQVIGDSGNRTTRSNVMWPITYHSLHLGRRINGPAPWLHCHIFNRFRTTLECALIIV